MRNFYALFLIALSSAVSASEGNSVYFILDSFSSSEPISIKAITSDWDDSFYGGDSAVTVNRVEMGFRHGNWEFGVGRRYDYLASMSEETAEFVYRTKNHLPLEIGKTYDLQLEVENAYSRSYRLGYLGKLGSNVDFNVSVSWLEGIKLTSGTIVGQAQAIAENDYNFNFDVDYYYSRDVLFYRENEEPTGQGYGLDLGFVWRASERLTLAIQANDVGARIDWDDAPYTVAHANSSNKTYDDDGYVVYLPMLAGVEGNRDYTQYLPTKYQLGLRYQTSDTLALLLEADHYDVAQFFRLGAGLGGVAGHQWEFLIDLEHEAPLLRYQSSLLSASLMSDTFSLDSARNLALSITFSYPF